MIWQTISFGRRLSGGGCWSDDISFSNNARRVSSPPIFVLVEYPAGHEADFKIVPSASREGVVLKHVTCVLV